jgi:hypothetical protein
LIQEKLFVPYLREFDAKDMLRFAKVLHAKFGGNELLEAIDIVTDNDHVVHVNVNKAFLVGDL